MLCCEAARKDIYRMIPLAAIQEIIAGFCFVIRNNSCVARRRADKRPTQMITD